MIRASWISGQVRKFAVRRPVRFDSLWSIPIFTLALFVIFPLALVPLLGVLDESLWTKLLAFALLLGFAFIANSCLRRPLNDNVDRVESALSALKEAPSCNQPIALILRSFSFLRCLSRRFCRVRDRCAHRAGAARN